LYFQKLECSRCGAAHDPSKVNNVCMKCGGALFTRYDIERVKESLTKERLAGKEKSLWRYRELLPVRDDSDIVTLGEGFTTLTVQTAPGPGGSLGDYGFSVIGTDPGGMSRSGSANLHVYDFGLETSPALLQILTTGSNTFTVTLTLTPGSSTVGLPSVGLTLSGLPAGATGTFVPTSGGASGFSSVLTITTSGTASGDYTLTITGTDARSPEGGTRTFSPTLEVLTPQQALALLMNQVNGLQASNVLTAGQANALDSKLSHVIASLNKGALNTACNQLDAFVNQVNAYVSTGVLTQAQADQLLGGPLGAFAIMTAMGC
jgi:FIMAH domain